MKTETVTVTYIGSNLVEVKPDVVFVDPGDAIEFVQAGMVGKMRVTFREKEFFNTGNSGFAVSGEFHLVDGRVHVSTALPHRTTYICELLDENDIVIARSADKGGGAAEPVKNAPKVGK